MIRVAGRVIGLPNERFRPKREETAMSVCYCTCPSEKLRSEPYAPCIAETKFEGAVLDTFERNGYDDSDFCAVVVDGENVKVVEYASTRYWTYHNQAVVDATPETIATATAWYRARWTQFTIEDAHEQATTVSKGKRVRSLMTRGKNVGITGEVKWHGVDGYRPHYGGCAAPMRVGIKVDGEQKLRYLPAERVEVIDPEPVDENAIIERGRTVTPPNWRSALYVGLGSLLR